MFASMAQWYGAGLESLIPKGYPGSIPGAGVKIKGYNQKLLNMGIIFMFYG